MNDLYLNIQKKNSSGLKDGYYQYGKNDYLSQLPVNFSKTLEEFATIDVLSMSENGWLCFISGGKLYTMGSNGLYQTGQNITVGSTSFPTEPLNTYSDWIDCSAGFNHGVAIRSNGKMYTWGYSTSYQTGQNTTTSIQVPTEVSGTWKRCMTGNAITFAINSDDEVYSAGSNINGRLGQNLTAGTTVYSQTFAKCVFDNSEVNEHITKVSVGAIHTFIVKSGTLYACGYQSDGRLGNGSTTGVSYNKFFSIGETGIQKIQAGNTHSLLLKTNGKLYGAGSDANNRMGMDGSTYSTFTQIGSDTNWEDIVLPNTANIGRNEFSWAIKGGELYGTGINAFGHFNQVSNSNITSWTRMGITEATGLSSLPLNASLSVIVKKG